MRDTTYEISDARYEMGGSRISYPTSRIVYPRILHLVSPSQILVGPRQLAYHRTLPDACCPGMLSGATGSSTVYFARISMYAFSHASAFCSPSQAVFTSGSIGPCHDPGASFAIAWANCGPNSFAK